jgi:hypothetical protein
MIIITNSLTNIVLHTLGDNVGVFRNWDNIILNNEDVIYGQTIDNTIIYKDVTDTPADFDWNKYMYDGALWSLNPDYNEPTREFLESVDGYYPNGNPISPQPPEIVV